MRMHDSQTSPLQKPKPSTERISVVIPCYNEERFITQVLNNLADQYKAEQYEIIIVDGMSDDRTRELIGQFSRQRPDLKIVIIDNPARKIPAALNLGIAAATGDIIARMDAHAVASPGYIRRCVEVLNDTGAGVVGMPCRVCPGDETLVAQAIAQGVSHKFGIGDAKYRLQEGVEGQEAVDTVAFGFFKKSIWKEIGGFNEQLLTNEDYDFNYRVRASGKTVLLDRSEHCDYFARSTFAGLIKQYWRYGSWKARMVLLNPKSIKVRHMIAPLFVVSIVSLFLSGFFFRPAWYLLALELASYLLLSFLFASQITKKVQGGVGLFLLMPLVFFTIHSSWGSAFFVGLVKAPR